jgi:anaerobic magnesium-protoporphyrin IX monomethyl ester cyclase
LFLLCHGAKILAHMFRGVTLKTLFGLENERKAFERYRAIRQAERIYA